MDHIHRHRGRFVTVLPASPRRQHGSGLDRRPRAELGRGDPPARSPPGDPARRVAMLRVALAVGGGHRVVWVHSSAKTGTPRLPRGPHRGRRRPAELTNGSPRPRARSKPRRGRQTPPRPSGATSARPVFGSTSPSKNVSRTDSGRPTRSPRTEHPLPPTPAPPPHPLTWSYARSPSPSAASDGCYPLITNDRDLARRRAVRRLQIPAQPRDNATPAQRHPARRAGAPAQPRLASKPCCAATSSPCSSTPSSNARSGRHGHHRHHTILSTPKTATAPHPPPPASLTSSTASPATTSTKTAASSRSSTPNSTPDNTPCSTARHPHNVYTE